MKLPTAPRSVTMKSLEDKKLRSVLLGPEEPRSVVDILEIQQDVSVAEHPTNHSYIDSSASLHILFNQELLGGIIQLD